ncbi:unnamed protein product [Arabidopsis halleri]
MFNQMETEIVFSGESETAFSETEMEAAEQLVQLSEEDTLSCSSGGTGWSVCGYDGCEGKGNNTKRQEDVLVRRLEIILSERSKTTACVGIRMLRTDRVL